MIERPAPSRPLQYVLATGILLLVLTFVAWDATSRSQNLLSVSSSYGEAVNAPQIDPSSPTGYAQGRSSLLLPRSAADTAHWLMQTQQMLHRGEARIREVSYDNAPAGREVHWASPHRWWIGAFAWIDHHLTNRPIGIAVERATLTSGPVMLGLFLIGLTPFLFRYFSPTASWLAAMMAAASWPFYADFLPARADHHALANICALLTVLFLLVGSRVLARDDPTSEPTGKSLFSRKATPWWIASALAGALGLWISASTQVPVLMAVATAVFIAILYGRRVPQRIRWLAVPSLWRVWGWAGGGACLIAYAIEYWPNHVGLRLEVNHPLYAIAWVGGGELLRTVSRVSSSGLRSLSMSEWNYSIVGMGALIALPLTISATGSASFKVADPTLWALHHLYIAEFQSLVRHLFVPTPNWQRIDVLLPMMLLLPPIGWLLFAKSRYEEKCHLTIALVPAIAGWCMGWAQVRWVSLGVALTFPVLAVSFHLLRGARSATKWAVVVAFLLLPGLVQAVKQSAKSSDITVETIQNLAERDAAHWLRIRSGDKPVVVAAGAGSTTKLVYYGGIAGLGTLYWENTAGLKNAMGLFGATSADSAYQLVRELGVTHLVHLSWDSSNISLAELQLGLPAGSELPRDTFVVQLLGAPVPPPWIRELAFQLPPHPALAGAQIRIWEVTEPMLLPEAAVRAATYQIESGNAGRAQFFGPLLARFPDNLAANVMSAILSSTGKNTASLERTMERILTQLDKAADLGLEDHVNLTSLLAQVGLNEEAGKQLRLCMLKANDRSLRQLSSDRLSELIHLSDGFGASFPSSELRTLAVELLPARYPE